jgi:putative ABC transport system substrate-binding protein
MAAAMDRRAFLSVPLAALSLRAHAATPTIGFLRTTSAAASARQVAAFQQGLAESGLAEGRDVALEYRWANNDLARLPALARDLVQRQVSVVVGNSQAAEAMKSASDTLPIVFVTSDDPVERGLVASMSRPGRNLTGVTFFGTELGAKRLEIMCEIVPSAHRVGVLADPTFPATQAELHDIAEAARKRALKVVVEPATDRDSAAAAFASLAREKPDFVLVTGSPKFSSMARDLVELAARYRLPAAYDQRDTVAQGGLLSYPGSFTDAYRLAGVYAARIVKGARPADLPVLQPTTFALVVNARTARALGLEIPKAVLLRASEVVE